MDLTGLKQKLQDNWKLVVEVLGALVGLLLLRNYFQKDLKSQVETAETDKKVAVLEAKKDDVKQEVAKEEADKSKLQEQLSQEPPKLSDREVLDFYNKKK